MSLLSCQTQIEVSLSSADIENIKKVTKDAVAISNPMVTLGAALYRAGRFTEARPHLEQAARLDPAGPNGLGAVQLLKKFPK